MTKQLTLGRLARATGMARASLLHYEALGLLVPRARSAAGYRFYGEPELERLRLIRRYRDVGLSLAAIRDLIAPAKRSATPRRPEPAAILERRLLDLSDEIDSLRAQRQLVARLLATREFRNVKQCRGKAAWTALLRRAGFSDAEMEAWHASFEAENPAEHAAFLASLGLKAAEIQSIRRWSKRNRSEDRE